MRASSGILKVAFITGLCAAPGLGLADGMMESPKPVPAPVAVAPAPMEVAPESGAPSTEVITTSTAPAEEVPQVSGAATPIGTDFGASTREWLALQLDPSAQSTVPRPMPGEIASSVYTRYANSFTHPIPETYKRQDFVSTGSGGSSSGSGGSNTR